MEEKGVKRQASSKNIVYAVLISVIVILAILAFTGEDLDLSLFLKLPFYWIIGALLLYLLALCINALRIFLLLRAFGIRFKYSYAFTNNLLMQYFNNITPFAAGGQPFQIYDLTRKGVDVTTAAAVIVSRYVMTNIAILTLAIFFLPKYWRSFLNIPGIGIFAFLGAFFTFALLVLLTTLSYSRKLLTKLVDLLVKPKFLRKLFAKRLNCEPEEVREKLLKNFEEFNYYMHFIWRKGPHYMFVDVGLAILSSMVFKFILYFLIIGLSKTSGKPVTASFLDVWGVQELLFLVAFYVPTPGASGALEAGLFFMLKDAIPKDLIAISVTLWRLLTYHFTIVVGSLTFFIQQIRRNKSRSNPNDTK